MAKFERAMIAVIALIAISMCSAASAAPRPLNDAERALVKAFSVYEKVGRYDYKVDLVFSDTIDDGEFVFSDEAVAKYGYTPHTKIIEASRTSRVSYSWYRGVGDLGMGVGIVADDGAWIAEASAGTESGRVVFLLDAERVGEMEVPPSVVNDMKEQDLFDQLEATRAGYNSK